MMTPWIWINCPSSTSTDSHSSRAPTVGKWMLQDSKTEEGLGFVKVSLELRSTLKERGCLLHARPVASPSVAAWKLSHMTMNYRACCEVKTSPWEQVRIRSSAPILPAHGVNVRGLPWPFCTQVAQ